MKTFITIAGAKRNLAKTFDRDLNEIATEFMFIGYTGDVNESNYDYLFSEFSSTVIENNQDIIPQTYYYNKVVAKKWLVNKIIDLKEGY